MTQDEIIEMACQAFGGVIKKEERDNFIAFAKLVAEREREAWERKFARLQSLMDLRETQPNKPCCLAEREACADLCEQYGFNNHCGITTDVIATEIRARGQA